MGFFHDSSGRPAWRHGGDLGIPERSYVPDPVDHPRLTPVAMAPWLTVLRLNAPYQSLPQRTAVLYVGNCRGFAIVAVPRPGAGWLVQTVPAEILSEYDELVTSLHPDVGDFFDGYEMGQVEALEERRISTQTKGEAPDWFGRGVRNGFRDRHHGLTDYQSAREALNRELRLVALLHPSEYPKGIPRLEGRS